MRRSARLLISGMSCSMTRIAQPGSVADVEQQRAERLGLALGDAGRRLVEQQDTSGRAPMMQARSTMRRRAGRQLADELVAEGAEAHQLDELVDLLAHRQLRLARRGQAEQRGRDGPRTSRWRSSATAMRLGDGERREEAGVLERAAQAVPRPAVRRPAR